MTSDASLSTDILCYRLDQRRFGIYLSCIQRVIQAMAITDLVDPPEHILGVIDVAGTILPTIDMRGKFGLPTRPVQLSDQFIIAKSSKFDLVLMVDEVTGLHRVEADALNSAHQIYDQLQPLTGAVKLDNDLVCIYDMDRFLSHTDQIKLDAALDKYRKL